jgi:hypothetical protein
MTSTRLLLAALLLIFAASMANAYTIVMRNGRRVEIPNQFTITGSTLTYEAGTGIQITIQLAGVDIPATEWANGEPRGSFFLKAAAQPQAATAAPARPAARRSITNKDLEGYRQTRIRSELAYEKRRKQLGLTSMRGEFAAIEDRAREQLLSMRSQDQAAEDYWRGRASSLRSELASNSAQMDYVRQRLNELPAANSFSTFSTYNPYGTFGLPGLNSPFNYGFGTGVNINLGQPRYPYGNNRGRFNRSRNNRGRLGPYYGANVLALPYQQYDYSYERSELSNQLNELEMQRTGLTVRWRELEEEARRAGAYPGWLRP